MTRRSIPDTAAEFSTARTHVAEPNRRTVEDDRPEVMDLEEREAVLRGIADQRAGRLASDEEVEAAYRRFRP